MDIYSFINSPDVAAYCREIGKTWTPFEMAVIIGRSDRRPMFEKHAAWRELITEYPDMVIPETKNCKSYDSLHKKLAEVIDYEERVLELFKTPESNTFYKYESSDYCSIYIDPDDVFTNFESALTELKDDLKYVSDWDRDKKYYMIMKKIYIGSNHRINCSFHLDGNIRNIFVAFRDELFPDINFDDLLDLSPGFGHEEIFYVDIPTPFKRGDIIKQGANIFVLERICDREKMFARESNPGSICGLCYYINDNGCLTGNPIYDNDCLEYYNGELRGTQRLLKYISMFVKGEINLLALLTLYNRIMLERQLENYSSPWDFGLNFPQEILEEEYGLKPEPVDPVIYSGIFWVIPEDNILTNYKLLTFGIKCDERGNIIGTPAIQPNSKSGKSYSHKITWETEIKNNSAHKPYNQNSFDYYPRGRVEITSRRAIIYLSPNINHSFILGDIKLKFGLNSHKISKIRIVEDNS